MLPLLTAIGIFVLFLSSAGVHRIEEGHIGLYWRGGALMQGYTEPGFHYMFPLITSYANIQITVQTDRVENIPVMINLLIISAEHPVVQ
jgi:hypothetical protein